MPYRSATGTAQYYDGIHVQATLPSWSAGDTLVALIFSGPNSPGFLGGLVPPAPTVGEFGWQQLGAFQESVGLGTFEIWINKTITGGSSGSWLFAKTGGAGTNIHIHGIVFSVYDVKYDMFYEGTNPHQISFLDDAGLQGSDELYIITFELNDLYPAPYGDDLLSGKILGTGSASTAFESVSVTGVFGFGTVALPGDPTIKDSWVGNIYLKDSTTPGPYVTTGYFHEGEVVDDLEHRGGGYAPAWSYNPIPYDRPGFRMIAGIKFNGATTRNHVEIKYPVIDDEFVRDETMGDEDIVDTNL